MAQAEALDRKRQSGAAIGPLHGLPVALKDIIDTRGIPTENGTALDAGRVPTEDAVVVQRLKAAGGVILGKTVTTELAGLAPGKTRNPVNPAHSPGGSSSGSAAAVSAGMAPLALGTQTGGSVIRPAAFCGIVGFKPSYGMIPRTGVLLQAPSLDTIGTFSRSVPDAALLAEALWGGDPGDRATEPVAPPRLLTTALSKPPVTPMFGMLTLPGSADIAPEMAEAMRELAGYLGEQAFDAALPNAFDEAAAIRERINYAELARCYYGYERRGADRLSPKMQGWLAEGKAIPARDYLSALDWTAVLYAGLEEILTRCDALLAPATLGPAPEGLGSTGSAIFNGLFTLTGVPVVTLPLFRAANGLPMGVQVIGRRGDDARVLRNARWLMEQVAEAEE
jgi:aspartyl-tRNA(Asn)/glutamyl-tRNA(Gln) amidotransferase subunit A